MVPVDISVPSATPAFVGTKDCKLERLALESSSCLLFDLS